MDLTIRPETPSDFPAIREVVRTAFGNTREPDGVENIRASEIYIPSLALVAQLDSEVVGYVMITHCTITGDAGARTTAMLTPLAVSPAHQRHGIGSVLVRAALAGAEAAGEPMVILQGSPRWYGSRGFEDSRPHGIHMELPDWAPREAGQVALLTAYDPDDPSLRGEISYPPVYG
ncbi:GCN5-related N-acetyltransferase [Janibacter sp. HTCC2649]|uniref:GNAT family N-acetyltransferase n=1 Tax=Janibacter sp. HTCC2649 TaxID=313589 RepID=UPI0000670851|nr:N-acetyltransferase [Janibacter sp. HTCC2649]EAQ00917.1 GCN5-related N-acetyltransferase [Janibacter sp. HTCC2649]